MTDETKQAWERAAKILMEGGRLVVARNVGEALDRGQPGAADMFGVRFMVSDDLEPGTIVALAPPTFDTVLAPSPQTVKEN